MRSEDALQRGAMLAEDFDALLDAFRLFTGFISTDTLRVFCVNHTAKELQSLGWIEPADSGRWNRGWHPAGAVKEALEAQR